MEIKDKKIIISDEVKNFLDRYCDEFFPKETGGIILGFQDKKNIYIAKATKSGPLAYHEKNRFKRDEKYTKQELDRIYKETKGNYDYIGEWHSHTVNTGISFLDRISLLTIELNPFNNVSNPLLLINIRKNNKWRKEVYCCCGFKIDKIDKINN